jgi:hypothetical protein
MTKILSCAAVLGLLVASSSSVLAKGPGGQGGGASHFTPAFESRQPAGHTTLTPVTGLSGPKAFAPGQQMNAFGSGSGHGASVYAPGFLK